MGFSSLAAFGLLTFLLMRMGFDRNGEITDRGGNLNYSTKRNLWDFRFYDFGGNASGTGALRMMSRNTKGTILGKLNGKAVCLRRIPA